MGFGICFIQCYNGIEAFHCFRLSHNGTMGAVEQRGSSILV